jgi:hypothetical protein
LTLGDIMPLTAKSAQLRAQVNQALAQGGLEAHLAEFMKELPPQM